MSSQKFGRLGLGLAAIAALTIPIAIPASAAPEAAASVETVAAPTDDRSSFTLPVLPDTQFYSRYSAAQFVPKYGTNPFEVQTQWIVDNQEALNIPFVAHVGDVVDQQWVPGEWDAAEKAMKILEDGDVPYSVIPGNHDVENQGARSSAANSYYYLNKFSASAMQRQAGNTLIGTFQNGVSSAYRFEAEGHDWISLAIAWNASDDTIVWAQSILDANPGVPVILTSHAVIGISDDQETAIDWAYGELLWDKLVSKNDQIILTVNGHFHGSTFRTRANNAGNPVYQVLTDYQMAADGGNGIMTLFEFDLTNNRVDVETVSPWVPKKAADTIASSDTPVLTGPGQSFSLALDFSERFGWEVDPADEDGADLSELAKKIVSEGWTGGNGGGSLAAAGSRDDYIEVDGTVAHWRFGSVEAGVVDETMEIPDVAGQSPMYRNPIAATDSPDELDDVTVTHTDSPFYSSDAGAICFSDVSRNDPKGDRLAFISTEYGAPATLAKLSSADGYTIETFLQLDPAWTETNNRWSAAINRGGVRDWAAIPDSSDGGAGVAWLGISSLREYQYTAATDTTSSSYTLWSGEIMPGTWHHVAIVNDPIADTAIMYVDGVPVLRNTSTIGGMKAVESMPWMIGTATWNSEPEHGWFGCVGETRIVDHALEESEFLTARVDIDGDGANFSLATEIPAEVAAGSSMSEFDGTGRPGSRVALVVNGLTKGTVPVADDGSWSMELAAPIAGSGAYSLEFVQSIGTRSGTPFAASLVIGDPVIPELPAEPGAPSSDDLIAQLEGLITVSPSSVKAGSIVTVSAGLDYATQTVDAVMWSEPTQLGRLTLGGDGKGQVMIPASIAAGEHRLALYGADGVIIGWAAFDVTAAAGSLAYTGIEIGAGVIALAVALLVGGGLLVILWRRRSEMFGETAI